MGLDIIEFALDKMTDAAEFEKLAAEVMYLEGFYDIHPLGGKFDLGQDAIQDRFYVREGKIRTIFQFTLQENLNSKLRSTIERLQAAAGEFSQLVIVTSRNLSAEGQRALIEIARKGFDVTLIPYDRKVLANRLSDLSNGLFSRHFPDIGRQLSDFRASSAGEITLEDALEEGLLKASIAFVFGERTSTTRKALFDELVMAALSDEESRAFSFDEVSAILTKHFPMIMVSTEQLQASVERLARLNKVKLSREGQVTLTSDGKMMVVAAISRAVETVGTLMSDIVGKATMAAGGTLSGEEERKLIRNARSLLVQYFRLFGIEITAQVSDKASKGPLFFKKIPDLIKIAGQQVTSPLGELLIAATAEVIQNPTLEQARALADWARAFVGSALLNVDPMLRHLHKLELSERVFVLDTDVILDIIVADNPRNDSLKKAVESILGLGARVIVPTGALAECAHHAEHSIHTYAHFGPALLGMDLNMIESRVFNAFAAGFAFARLGGRIGRGVTFGKYLENYYEKSNPLAFMTQVAKTSLPDGVEIIGIEEALGEEIDAGRRDKFYPIMLKLASQSRKAQYRSSDETETLALADSTLAASVLQLCMSSTKPEDRSPLAGRCYIITNSARYLRACEELGIEEAISVRPQQLISIIELMTGKPLDDISFVRLFENPFLIAAVDQVWESAKVLLDDGLSLVGKNLARLRWDFSMKLHSEITLIEQTGRAPEDKKTKARLDEEGADLLLKAVRLGYNLNPAFDVVQRALGEKDMELDATKSELVELSERFIELKKQIEQFGRRRQRYLRKIAEGRN